MAKRYKRMAHELTTLQVAHILGVGKKTLYRMLQDGRIPEPPRNPDNNYRIWLPQEVDRLREVLTR
jgi:predicted DNA-binding transcriptional regulator AlpA